MKAENVQLHLKIHGRVQGVYFRSFTRRNAEKLGIRGWVKNMDDATVEALVQGSAEAVDEMKKKLQKGPVAAQVDQIEELDSDETKIYDSFTIAE